MTVEEIIASLLERIANEDDISVSELRDIVEEISVIDTVAASGALTVFYSGEDSGFINMFAEKAGNKVRMIDRTDAYRLLDNNTFKYDILSYANKKAFCLKRRACVENYSTHKNGFFVKIRHSPTKWNC
ncbi:MAG: hypothetical protein IKY44_00050 [Clostridia bacterium]|nr:hypothetical protein [Clostridia bacterium]